MTRESFDNELLDGIESGAIVAILRGRQLYLKTLEHIKPHDYVLSPADAKLRLRARRHKRNLWQRFVDWWNYWA